MPFKDLARKEDHLKGIRAGSTGEKLVEKNSIQADGLPLFPEIMEKQPRTEKVYYDDGNAYVDTEEIERNRQNALIEMAAGEKCEENGQLEEAFEHYNKAAGFGDAKGAFYVGYMYERGEGVQKNLEHAVDWYSKAAKMGNRGAQHNLGYFYYSGTGVKQNLKLAFDYFLMAAKQGKSDSMKNIGVMYQNGEYVAQDYSKALEWYQRAANNGDADAKKFYDALKRKVDNFGQSGILHKSSC